MFGVIGTVLRRLFLTTYSPDPVCSSFLERAERQEHPLAQVTAAVLDEAESERIFGLPLARRGIQPVFLRIVNRSDKPLRLQITGIDPNYYTPLEAAALNHFSIVKRLSEFGLLGFMFYHFLLLILPSKLFTAYRANRRIDDYFRSRAFRLRPIEPQSEAGGFVFTQLDSGTKVFHVCLYAAEKTQGADAPLLDHQPAIDLVFSIPVPGIAVDYLKRNFSQILASQAIEDCDEKKLAERLQKLPAATTNRHGTRSGDPANLVVIGDFATLLSSFVSRWDETETISLKTCWKTVQAFLRGKEYRYSPVSPLFLLGRSQDVALQRIRHSINQRLHLRLWLTTLQFRGQAVWIGQISRDIGVRFTTKAWNLTTHRIDPEVDEARDYLVEDLLKAEHLKAVGYVEGVGECESSCPRHNLTGDPYFTDGKRVVLLLSASRTRPHFVSWG